jgi:predicted GNAT family acetyltransferase
LAVVRDNPTAQRFELEVEGLLAVSTYRREPGCVTFLHTEVPNALQGKGVGSELARGALVAVRKRGDKVVARCPFIAAFIQKHPEFQDLLASAS